jgi:hypothetical protein
MFAMAIIGYALTLAVGIYFVVAGFVAIRVCLAFSGTLADRDGIISVIIFLAGIAIIAALFNYGPVHIRMSK